ncbi:LysE family translocator [Corynebacterium glutamicum]|uniref:LysE family translocator n=1 Tax=Corynebacterium glutamicum TaxID=1718 RepID=UPI0021BD0247|nr:LysE family translocator [Corynebacterium glutamicum]
MPGPDLVLVLHSATRGIRTGVMTAAGIMTGLMLHASLAIAGATALLLSAPGVLSAIQLLGAGVLLWMGTNMFCASQNTGESETAASQSGAGYFRGFITNATNPKALLFFAAILPQFIGNGEDMKMRTVALCATIVLGSGAWWLGTIALVRGIGLQKLPSADRIITLVGGIALFLIGAGLLVNTAYGLIT